MERATGFEPATFSLAKPRGRFQHREAPFVKGRHPSPQRPTIVDGPFVILRRHKSRPGAICLKSWHTNGTKKPWMSGPAYSRTSNPTNVPPPHPWGHYPRMSTLLSPQTGYYPSSLRQPFKGFHKGGKDSGLLEREGNPRSPPAPGTDGEGRHLPWFSTSKFTFLNPGRGQQPATHTAGHLVSRRHAPAAPPGTHRESAADR